MRHTLRLNAVLVVGFAMVWISATPPSGFAPTKATERLVGEWIAPASADTIKNPFKGNAASVEDGKKIYAKNCSVCHGDKGKGDGIASAGLTPRPADHSSEKTQKQSDGALFWKITNGRPPMAAYAKIYTPAQRWAVVNFIRTLKAPSGKK